LRGGWAKIAEFEQASQATVAGKEVPGLRERWLAQDATDPDGGFAVSVWETREALQAYEQNAVFTQDLLLYGFGQIIYTDLDRSLCKFRG
jgi:hypothetical protein